MNWKFWRRKAIAEENELQFYLRDLFDWERKMEAAGYRPYMSGMVPCGVPLELMRREWATISVCTREEMPPYMNVADLWWRTANGPIISGTKILDLSLMSPRGSA